ncbi:MAG: OmpA family protein [Bacteroidota bacterium]
MKRQVLYFCFPLLLILFFPGMGLGQPAIAPENLGSQVNSSYEELLPVITPDGSRLYFARKYHPDNYYHPEESQEIWYSDYNEQTNSWAKAVHMGKDFNAQTINGIGTISPDGNTILVRGATENGEYEGVAFSLRQKGAEGWSKPQKMEIKQLKEMARGMFMGGTLAGNGKVLILYFGEELMDEKNDLYVSFLTEDGSWTKPEGLGADLNTGYSEAAPFLASDSKTLYFASDRPGGQGNYDIYKTQRLDDSWKKWSEPVNLGSPINTKSFDAYYTVDAEGEYAYMVSEEESLGGSDIIRIRLKEEQRPDPVTLVSGKIMDRVTGEPLVAQVRYQILPGRIEAGIARSNAEEGVYKVTLPYGFIYQVTAEAEGYQMAAETIDLTKGGEFQLLEKNLFLTPGESKAPPAPLEMKTNRPDTKLATVYFNSGEVQVKEESKEELALILEILRTNPHIHLTLRGHADIVGSDNDNMDLSTYRARMVRAYLISEGISPARLSYIGYGNTIPSTLDRTDEGLALNRRVEFHVIK